MCSHPQQAHQQDQALLQDSPHKNQGLYENDHQFEILHQYVHHQIQFEKNPRRKEKRQKKTLF
jgi:hypothetical protein